MKGYRYGSFSPGNSRMVIDLNQPVRAADRHVAHAAAIEQILEMVRHETMAGRAFDPASIATLSDQLSIALMRANNAIRKAKAMKVTSKENRRARHRHIRQSG